MAFLTSNHAFPLDPRLDPSAEEEEERERLYEHAMACGALYDDEWMIYEELSRNTWSCDVGGHDKADDCLIRARLLQ